MSDRDALLQAKAHIDQAKVIVDSALAVAPGTPIETPNPGAGTQPGTGTIPAGAHVDFDLGTGGGGFLPHDDRIFPANTWVTIGFTVPPGDHPNMNIDISPGTGNWRSGSTWEDTFPDVMAAPEQQGGLPIGNNYVGRGSEHAPGIPIECYAPGPHRYAVRFSKDQTLHFQFRP